MSRLLVIRPALLSHGFRVFFLLALMFAVFVVPYWMAVFFGIVEFSGSFSPLEWHVHEMIFGYAAAVIAGFLFTAIPNWTGRLPLRGWPLAALAVLWASGRAVLLGFGDFSVITSMAVDCAFLLAVTGIALREIIVGKNWRNLVVLVPISLLLAANILYHVEVVNFGGANYGSRFGLSLVIFLITLIGGRIIPSFTRNWLVKRGMTPLPTPLNRFDAVCLLVGGTSLPLWVGLPNTTITKCMLCGASLLHAIRLSRWAGIQTLTSPLLLSLHTAYAFVPAGLLILGLGYETAGVHILGIGAIAGMTVAVIVRASAGHTGRPLVMRITVIFGFSMILLSAVVRVSAWAEIQQPMLVLAACFWTCGFMLVLWKIGPWLLTKNASE